MSQYASNLAPNATGSNPSVGATGSPAPAFATEIGFVNSGNLVAVSMANPLPVTIDGGLANPLNVNIADFGGTAVTIGQHLSAASMPVVLASDQSAIPVSQSGTWNINNISGTVSLPTGASTSALQSTGNTSLASILANQTNGTQVVIGSGTAGTPSAGILTIQGNASGTPVPVSGTISVTGVATAANQTSGAQKTQIVDGADVTVGPVQTISGTNYMPVVLAASATPGSPLVARSIQVAGSDGTNAQTLSTDSTGKLNINNISGTVSLPTGAATSALQSTGNTSLASILANQTNGTQVVGYLDSSPATQNITAQDVASTSTTISNGQVAITGTPTAGSAASFSLANLDAIEVQVTNVWTGTVQVEVSMDGGITWYTRGVKQSGVSYISNSFTQNFEGGMNYGGMTNVRVRATAAWTGTATVKVVASVNPASIIVSNPQLLRDTTTQSITNTIKAASTAAVATDTALVVAISPNNTVKTSSAANANGSLTGTVSVTTTEASTAAPANAVGVVFEAESGNATNIRWGVSNSASNILSTSNGVLMEPGRSIDFLPIGTGTFLHYISTAAGSNSIDIQWILSS